MAVALRLALFLIAAACACLFLAHPVWFPAGVSAQSPAIDHQFAVAFWILGGLFLAAHVVLAASLMRTRQSDKPSNSHGDWRMEALWTLSALPVRRRAIRWALTPVTLMEKMTLFPPRWCCL